MWIDPTSSVRDGQEGQTMVEYAVVLGMITLAIVATFSALSGGIGAAVTTIAGRI
jgi:Flp pilus assembly pilin Flp